VVAVLARFVLLLLAKISNLAGFARLEINEIFVQIFTQYFVGSLWFCKRIAQQIREFEDRRAGRKLANFPNVFFASQRLGKFP